MSTCSGSVKQMKCLSTNSILHSHSIDCTTLSVYYARQCRAHNVHKHGPHLLFSMSSQLTEKSTV